MELTKQQQDIILALQKEVDYYQRRAAEANEKVALLLAGLGVNSVNIVLIPIPPPEPPQAPATPPPAPSPAPPNS